jgi:hypothetical protein
LKLWQLNSFLQTEGLEGKFSIFLTLQLETHEIYEKKVSQRKNWTTNLFVKHTHALTESSLLEPKVYEKKMFGKNSQNRFCSRFNKQNGNKFYPVCQQHWG